MKVDNNKYVKIDSRFTYYKFDKIDQGFEFTFINAFQYDSQFGAQDAMVVRNLSGEFVIVNMSSGIKRFAPFFVTGKNYILEYDSDQSTKEGNTFKAFNLYIKKG